ncbi:PLP-dependent transferase [Thozetella sp. PMI_491]|nr:PLP-dependent transferase [Thozetella sp. PMI_491]
MKDIREFKIDQWSTKHSGGATVLLHGSNVRALSLAELLQLVPGHDASPVNFDAVLSYGNLYGSVQLRQRIAELHSSDRVKLTEDNVILTPGSILAGYLALTNLAGPGDHVICEYPTYSQLFILPKYQGAEVSLWKLKREHNWVPQLDDLKSLVKPNTRVIILNSPNNPTGAVLSEAALLEILAFAKERNITVYSDEVFRPMFHTSEPIPPPFVTLGYENSLSTGSLSKAQGLPGIRIGWVVSQDRDLLERIMNARSYTTITVSQLDCGVAQYALSPAVLPALMERNLTICRRSLDILDGFAKRHPGRVDYVPSKSGGTAFVRLLEADGSPVDERAFALRMVATEKLSLLPGDTVADEDATEFRGYFRVSLGDDVSLQKGVDILDRVLNE